MKNTEENVWSSQQKFVFFVFSAVFCGFCCAVSFIVVSKLQKQKKLDLRKLWFQPKNHKNRAKNYFFGKNKGHIHTHTKISLIRYRNWSLRLAVLSNSSRYYLFDLSVGHLVLFLAAIQARGGLSTKQPWLRYAACELKWFCLVSRKWSNGGLTELQRIITNPHANKTQRISLILWSFRSVFWISQLNLSII